MKPIKSMLLKVLASAVLLVGACRSVHVERHADRSWKASYWSYGTFTSLGNLEFELSTNGVVRLRIDDLNADMSTNHYTVVDKSGKVVAEITGSLIHSLLMSCPESELEGETK